jgi:hypothetical protein
MAIDYSLLPLSKGTPRCLQKARKKKLDAKDERACREIVRARDKGRCRVPNCNERSGRDAPHRAAVAKFEAEMGSTEQLFTVQGASRFAAQRDHPDQRRRRW